MKALVQSRSPGEVAVGLLGAELEGEVLGWESVKALVPIYPQTDKTKTLVVVVDPSIILAIADGVVALDHDSLTKGTFGPLYPVGRPHHWGSVPVQISAVAALTTPVMKELRSICEHDGISVVVVTVDARPDHGTRREILKIHRFRDGRVRTLLGDAARYHCHLRYLVESTDSGVPTWIGMTKDEGEGLPGRMLWEMPTGSRWTTTTSAAPRVGGNQARKHGGCGHRIFRALIAFSLDPHAWSTTARLAPSISFVPNLEA